MIQKILMLLLLFEGCTSNQFTCSNGQCVPSSSRCNNVRECTDGSDESNCGNIQNILIMIIFKQSGIT